MKLGIDIGSTTIKLALITEGNEVIYCSYERHYSKINEKLVACLDDLKQKVPFVNAMQVAITGSAGMGLAEDLGIGFIQEVFATKVAADTYMSDTDVIIELGGEDAKILFLTSGLEVRMNGTCAGGTGAFIDQIATLLALDVEQMNEASKYADKVYPIASRCGVFAKSDIQPLLNQGAKKEDLAASIFQAVVNQTITGLAQGRQIQGKVLYLGGPLTFMSQLRRSFDTTLGIEGINPENALHYVAMGCALCADTACSVDRLRDLVVNYKREATFEKTEALFEDTEAYETFRKRHATAKIAYNTSEEYEGDVCIGIDAGSTTIKIIVIDQEEHILFSAYQTNGGNPIPPIKVFLEKFYQKYPKVRVRAATVTGYGEEMIKTAFGLDFGIVETVAHYQAAKQFNPDVDFIIDIGGQDMKCFKIVDSVIDDIFLNEACSSGCGSFLQSFAQVLGYDMENFAKIGLFADAPVDLGSRCTVFMNSSVKQAQKDGASVENIAAGLAISVVKNAIYKVIRATKAEELGKHIVVQGGTFLNDAVLRAFEKEIDGEVVRPNIAGMMGAYGAALYGKHHVLQESTMLGYEGLKAFRHTTHYTQCKGCTNQCALTINTFDNGRRFIAGNRCDVPTSKHQNEVCTNNLYAYKQGLLQTYMTSPVEGVKTRGKIGLPMILNMYDLLPFWHAFFSTLGFEVVCSGFSTEGTYASGQHTIPSDTVCFPAKLVHGHIETLVKKEVDAIFYPCMTYNIDEHRGDNHFNCPVVAYYPESIANNMSSLKQIPYIYDYIGIHRPKDFVKKLKNILNKHFGDIPMKLVKQATDLAFKARIDYLEKVRQEGQRMIDKAREKHQPIVVLAGRPYHLDAKVNHGIDKLVSSYGVTVITEDAVCHLTQEDRHVDVLNQWTYHARLYDAAKYVASHDDMHLIQLVSFGCGVDAVTTDELRSILHQKRKIYTQLKIDEITNLGAVKIRIRSLLAAIE